MISTFMADINDHLVKDGNSLKFTLKDTDHDLTFTPHYRQYQQRYGIYWNFQSSSTAVDRPARSKKTVVDTVQPGYGQYENDNLHNMQEFNTQGVTDDSTYRYAKSGGHFSYRMAVNKEADYNILTVKFRKSDNGKSIRITVSDTVLNSATLYYTGDKDVYDVNIIIPPEVIEKNSEHITADGEEYDVVTVGFDSGNGEESAKICDFIYMTAVKPLYEYNSSIAYFVDCGDHDPYTLTGRDKLGFYNSVTEQLFGPDEVTGAYWGLMDDPTDQYDGGSKSGGLYTANTWCDEYNTADNRDKTASFRYTKNQYENNMERTLTYGFWLPAGKYEIEMCFSDPWGCSTKPYVRTACDTNFEKILMENCETDGNTPSVCELDIAQDGIVDICINSEDKAINLNYIIIRTLETSPLPTIATAETVTLAGDTNCDGIVDLSDAILIMQALANPNRYGLGGSDEKHLTEQGKLNGDVDRSTIGLTSNDAVLIQNYLLHKISSLENV
jgi:hypothetical protein